MSENLHGLVARLRVLSLSGHPLGLTTSQATRFEATVKAGGSMPQAFSSVGRGDDLARCLEVASPPDPVSVTAQLVGPLAEARHHRLALRSAAVYPTLVLGLVSLLALTMRVVALPALEVMARDFGGHSSTLALSRALAVSGGLLVALVLVVALEIPLPPFGQMRLHGQRALLFAAMAALVRAGVPLPRAIRASGALTRVRRLRNASDELAGALEAGGRAFPSSLLEPTASRMLQNAATHGVAGPVLQALARRAGASARSAASAHAWMMQFVALGIAGLDLTLVAVAWFSTYSSSLVGL